MSTATMEKRASADPRESDANPQPALMKFRLLSGGFDQTSPAFKGKGTVELRQMVLTKRGVTTLDKVDSANEAASVEQLTRPQLLQELGAGQRFRADSSTGFQPVIEADIDLEKRFGRTKFARMQEDSPPRVVERIVEKRVLVDFDEMNLEELRNFAAEEEIELSKDADTKAKILQLIRSARRQK